MGNSIHPLLLRNSLASRPSASQLNRGVSRIPLWMDSWHPSPWLHTSPRSNTFICTLGQTLGADISNCHREGRQTMHCCLLLYACMWLHSVHLSVLWVCDTAAVGWEDKMLPFWLPRAHLYSNTDLFLLFFLQRALLLFFLLNRLQTETKQFSSITHSCTPFPPALQTHTYQIR